MCERDPSRSSHGDGPYDCFYEKATLCQPLFEKPALTPIRLAKAKTMTQASIRTRQGTLFVRCMLGSDQVRRCNLDDGLFKGMADFLPPPPLGPKHSFAVAADLAVGVFTSPSGLNLPSVAHLSR
jgi:hypothetical protein